MKASSSQEKPSTSEVVDSNGLDNPDIMDMGYKKRRIAFDKDFEMLLTVRFAACLFTPLMSSLGN